MFITIGERRGQEAWECFDDVEKDEKEESDDETILHNHSSLLKDNAPSSQGSDVIMTFWAHS